MQSEFGNTLKHWRNTRRMSQLQLGLEANVSARHISFLESGRARPSSQMVVQLAQSMDVPLSSRNQMLAAAGFADRYKARALAEAEMAPVRAAMERMLVSHNPMPGFVLDRHWFIVSANQAFTDMIKMLGLSLEGSLLEALINLNNREELFDNWPEFGFYLSRRLQTESTYLGGDDVLNHAIAKLGEDPLIREFERPGTLPAIIPIRIRQGDMVLSFVSTIAQFGSTEDVALADLRIELMFPADALTTSLYPA